MRRSSAPLSLSHSLSLLSTDVSHYCASCSTAVTGPSPNNDTLIPARELEGGRASRANRAVSLASEPAEKLIKGWDCRLEPEAVSTSRAPCSVCIITALNAGKISTLLAPASTLPDYCGTPVMCLKA